MNAQRATEPVIEATAIGGLTVTLPDGRCAKLAIIDDCGNVIASEGVTRQAFEASCRAYRNFLQGNGHIRAVAGAA